MDSRYCAASLLVDNGVGAGKLGAGLLEPLAADLAVNNGALSWTTEKYRDAAPGTNPSSRPGVGGKSGSCPFAI